MENPLVSIIIPNYNYGRFLAQTIHSALGQSYSNTEVIVIDDGSTDDSEAVLRGFGNRIRWFRGHRKGVSTARNLGVQESRGQFVAFLDADDVWLPAKLTRQVRRILDDPEIGLVHCGVEEIDSAGTSLRTFIDGMEGWVAKEMLLFKRSVIIGLGSTGLLPRSTFEAVGGFDERLSTSADWELSYRVARRQRVGFVPEALVQYRIHNSNMHAKIEIMEHDVLVGYAKAFNTDDPELLAIRRQCYGNIHLVLAGSYVRAGKPLDFARHALHSVRYAPGNLMRLLEFPKRSLKRKRVV